MKTNEGQLDLYLVDMIPSDRHYIGVSKNPITANECNIVSRTLLKSISLEKHSEFSFGWGSEWLRSEEEKISGYQLAILPHLEGDLVSDFLKKSLEHMVKNGETKENATQKMKNSCLCIFLDEHNHIHIEAMFGYSRKCPWNGADDPNITIRYKIADNVPSNYKYSSETIYKIVGMRTAERISFCELLGIIGRETGVNHSPECFAGFFRTHPIWCAIGEESRKYYCGPSDFKPPQITVSVPKKK